MLTRNIREIVSGSISNIISFAEIPVDALALHPLPLVTLVNFVNRPSRVFGDQWISIRCRPLECRQVIVRSCISQSHTNIP